MWSSGAVKPVGMRVLLQMRLIKLQIDVGSCDPHDLVDTSVSSNDCRKMGPWEYNREQMHLSFMRERFRHLYAAAST